MIDDELAEHWDATHLAVYADQLVEAGDPRGELVALDLADSNDEIRARKRELLVAWIGEQLLGRIEANGSIEHGFVELSTERPGLLGDVLASPAGPYVRSLTLRARTPELSAMLELLSRDVRPWLQRLALRQDQQLRGRSIVRSWDTQLPRLRVLEVEGDRVFEQLVAPSVTHLKLTSGGAIASLADGRLAWRDLRVLDIAFGPGGGRPRTALAADAVPALVELDLSRNEPGAFTPHNLGLDIDPFLWLAQCAVPGQLQRLRVPSVRTEAQAQLLGEAIARMPLLQRVEQVRRYAARDARFPVPPQVERVVGWPRPWLPPDEANGYAYNALEQRLDLFPAAHWLDEHAARVPPHVVDAWGHVFATLTAMAPGDAHELPLPLLDSALSALGETPGLFGWLRLRRQLRIAKPVRVAIRRV